MVDLIPKVLNDTPYLLKDILNHFELDGEEALFKVLAKNNEASWSRFREALNCIDTSNGFKLRARATHVYREAQRVYLFKEVCDSSTLTNEEKIRQLGELMDDSHASCRDLYECSCKELDQLVQLSKKAGARGSRLTGAGWGGCTVSLVRDDDCGRFEETLRSSREDTFTFNSKPSSGVTIYNLHQ
jgi:N-acetylgalactosamine kinase